MLYELFVAGYVLICILLGIIVLVQPSKSSSGIGGGGETQMLFGGSGGQDFLQKTTWVLGALVMLGSLSLSLWKTKQEQRSTVQTQQQAPQE